jgi:hypothetical protein
MNKQVKPIDRFIAVVTLGTALLGFFTGCRAFQEQNRKIESLNIPKPLEGIWNYTVDYEIYHNEDYKKEPEKKKRMEGMAAFVWSTGAKTNGYDVLISAKVYLVTDTTKKPIVVVSSRNRLVTPESGGPAKNLSMSGQYLARLSADSAYANVADTNYFYDNLKAQLSADGTHIDKITFDFRVPEGSRQPSSKGTVMFSR